MKSRCNVVFSLESSDEDEGEEYCISSWASDSMDLSDLSSHASDCEFLKFSRRLFYRVIDIHTINGFTSMTHEITIEYGYANNCANYPVMLMLDVLIVSTTMISCSPLKFFQHRIPSAFYSKGLSCTCSNQKCPFQCIGSAW